MKMTTQDKDSISVATISKVGSNFTNNKIEDENNIIIERNYSQFRQKTVA